MSAAVIAAPTAPAPVAAVAEQFTIDSSLQIKDVESVHQRLMATLTGPAVTLDFSPIQTIDTAGVQLLLAFEAEAARRSIVLEFAGESPAVSQALTMLGLRDRLRVAPSRG